MFSAGDPGQRIPGRCPGPFKPNADGSGVEWDGGARQHRQARYDAKAVPTSSRAVLKLLRDLVDLVGIEPTTSSMPWKRAPSCATGPLSEAQELGLERECRALFSLE